MAWPLRVGSFSTGSAFLSCATVHSVYSQTNCPTQAVIYDRDWFLDTIRSCGLSVQQTIYPPMPGHQWNVLLTRRTPNAVDEFPLGEYWEPNGSAGRLKNRWQRWLFPMRR